MSASPQGHCEYEITLRLSQSTLSVFFSQMFHTMTDIQSHFKEVKHSDGLNKVPNQPLKEVHMKTDINPRTNKYIQI